MEAKNSFVFLLLTSMTFVVMMLYLVSCGESPEKVHTASTIRMMDDTLLNFNQQVVKNESQEIDDFIRRYHWKMKTTQTGLRYMIYKNGKGHSARKGDVVSIRYSVNLLNGDLVFKSDSLMPFKFEIGKRKVTNGLEEGVMLMKPGDKAKLVVPSHLAFGLIGDLDRIPNRAILVYDVEIYQINESN